MNAAPCCTSVATVLFAIETIASFVQLRSADLDGKFVRHGTR
jgi:hypothetical protein